MRMHASMSPLPSGKETPLAQTSSLKRLVLVQFRLQDRTAGATARDPREVLTARVTPCRQEPADAALCPETGTRQHQICATLPWCRAQSPLYRGNPVSTGDSVLISPDTNPQSSGTSILTFIGGIASSLV